jgi:ABC-type Fe3+/spermidine/putrescine transport system ATPase subunit
VSVAVTIEDLSVSLGGTEVLSGVTLEAAPGEFVTLLGPSGSGKTTTLNVLAGFVRHTKGRVALGGEVVDALPPHRRNIGFVFQSYALFPHMTVERNVAYPLAARKVPRAEVRRIHERTGMTTIAVTHDQVEAMTMSDRVVILDDGRVSQVGTPEEVYERPANLFVAGFLGEANLLAVRDGAVPALGVAAGGAKQGTAVVRPEHVALTDDPAGRPGTVTDASFQGTRMRLAVRLESGESIIVSAPVEAVADRPARGDAVRVRSIHQTVHAVGETATAATTTAAAVEPAGSHP